MNYNEMYVNVHLMYFQLTWVAKKPCMLDQMK